MGETKFIPTDQELDILSKIYTKLQGANRGIIIMSANLLLASQEAVEQEELKRQTDKS